MSNNYNMFKQIILTETGYSEGKKLHTIDCNDYDKDNIDATYLYTLQNLKCPYELIGKKGQQIKPCFDLDPKFDKNQEIDIIKTLKEGKEHIQIIYPKKNIYYYCRIRELEQHKKFSYHAIVDGIRTDSKTIIQRLKEKQLYKNDKPFDISIYSENRGLYPVYSKKKKGPKPGEIMNVEQFLPIDEKGNKLSWSDIDIRNYCSSYIEENFDTDFYEPPTGPEYQFENKNIFIDNIQDENSDYQNINLEEIITKLNSKRAYDRDDWLNGCFCILNCAEAKGLSKKKQKDLVHKFSEICPEKYNEDEIEDWLDANFDKKRETGYRFKFLFDWLKEDNFDYYKEHFYNKKEKILTYKETKEQFELKHFKLLHPAMLITIEEDEIICQKIDDAAKSFEHLQFKEYDKKENEWKNKQFFIQWRKDPNMKIHRKMGWKPPPLEMDHPDDFNLFEDFKIKKIKLVETERNYFKEYFEFGNNLFGDKKINNYIFSMMAYKVQNPAYRTDILTILSGGEGDGKSTFVRTFFKLFDNNSMELHNLNHFFEDKNTIEYRKLLICIDDVSGNGNFEHDGQLRARITGNKLTVRPLYEQAKIIDNHADYWMTTNNKNVVKMGDDTSRRFFQTETTKYYLNDTIFWDDFNKNIFNNPVALRQIYEGLKNFDFKQHITKGFQSIEDKPETEIMKLNKLANRDKISYFYHELMLEIIEDIDEGNFESYTVKYKNKDLFKKWKKYCEHSNIKSEMNNIQFGIKTKSFNEIINTKISQDAFFKDSKHSTTTIHFDILKIYMDELFE
jgi:hypothetical protein